MSLRSRSTLHCAIFPKRSDNVKRVVATIAEVDEVELSSEPELSPPGEPLRFFVRSFLIRVNRTGWSLSLSDFFAALGGGGLTPVTSMISPHRLRGLTGGGCLLGSVGLSEEVDADGRLLPPPPPRLVGGGVMGRGIRRVGGDGVGEGGRALPTFFPPPPCPPPP